MNVVLDDRLLRDVLIVEEPRWLRRKRGRGSLVTTGTWYYRLCGALTDPHFGGSLSGPIAGLPGPIRTSVLRRVVELPDTVQLTSLSELAWGAAGLGRKHGLNLLAAEALAAALHHGAGIAAGGVLPPRLFDAAEAEGIPLLSEGTSRLG